MRCATCGQHENAMIHCDPDSPQVWEGWHKFNPDRIAPEPKPEPAPMTGFPTHGDYEEAIPAGEAFMSAEEWWHVWIVTQDGLSALENNDAVKLGFAFAEAYADARDKHNKK